MRFFGNTPQTILNDVNKCVYSTESLIDELNSTDPLNGLQDEWGDMKPWLVSERLLNRERGQNLLTFSWAGSRDVGSTQSLCQRQ